MAIQKGLGQQAWETINSSRNGSTSTNDLPYSVETLDAMMATLPAGATPTDMEQMAAAVLAAITGENPWYKTVGRATLAAAYERLAKMTDGAHND